MQRIIPTIIIPEGNDFNYCLRIEDLPADVQDLRVWCNTIPTKSNEVSATIEEGAVVIPFSNLKQGEYNIWVEYTQDEQAIAFNISKAFKIVAWNNQYTNWKEYMVGGSLFVDAGAYLKPNGRGTSDVPLSVVNGQVCITYNE